MDNPGMQWIFLIFHSFIKKKNLAGFLLPQREKSWE